MTDLPYDPLDELASAHLDGLTSVEEARRIEGDPALLDRVARLEAARDAVRLADVPVDPERRERAIAAALAVVAGAATAPVTSLAEVRARRGPPVWIRVVGAAAAVALAVILIPRLARDGHDPTTTAAAPSAADDARSKSGGDAAQTSGGDSPTAQADSGPAAVESAPSDLPAGATTTVPSPTGSGTTLALVDLGQVADLDALATAVRAELGSPTAPVATPPADPAARDACLATLQVAGPDGTGRYVLNGVARVGGQEVLATVTPELDDTRTLRVYAVSGCDLVDTRPV